MKKYIFLMMVLLLLGGCTKEATAPAEEEIIETEEQQTIIEESLTREDQTQFLKDYYSMISSKEPDEDIVKAVDENASMLDEDIMDQIVLSLEDHLMLSSPSIKDLSGTLIKYRDYSSDEIKSYLDILDIEGQMLFTDGETMIVSLSDLIDRGIKAETHLRSYPNGKTKAKVNNYYSAYVYAAIQGVGNQYIYVEEGSSKIREDVLNQYKEVIKNNPDFNMSKIFQLYIDTLNLDGYDLNGKNVLEFYKNLEGTIEHNSKF
ncbi:hypothetical protein E9840_10970 [Tissierella creatinini]|nr:hypothetical protein E9840_10970 [Tissierella creatinini]TJX63575.1 hypothetical protein E8P77_14865 [Soehngenia saccharolytica]